METPSLARMATTHSAAQARSAWFVDARQAAGARPSAPIRPRGCRRDRASRRPSRCAAVRIEPPKVEREDLVVPVAAKLHRHQREQHRLAGAGRADDQRVADIADVQAQAETASSLRSCRTAAAAPAEMLVASRVRPRPQKAESCEPGSGSRSAAGGRLHRHGPVWSPSQASNAFTPSGMQVKSRPWMTFSTSRSFSAARPASSSQTVTVAVT